MSTPVNSDKSRQGKVFEAKVAKHFKPLQETLPVQFKRIMDSREAGNLVRTTEADFEFLVKSDLPGRPFRFLIECKSSDKFTEFSSCFRSMIKPQQRALMMLAERAGSTGYYLFYSSQSNEIEVWRASVLLPEWPKKRQALTKHPLLRIAPASLHSLAQLMATKPSEFVD